MSTLTVGPLTEPQIEAFTALFPALHRSGLVAEKGLTRRVITLDPAVFRKGPGHAADQLADSAEALWGRDVHSKLRMPTVRALAGKLRSAVLA